MSDVTYDIPVCGVIKVIYFQLEAFAEIAKGAVGQVSL